MSTPVCDAGKVQWWPTWYATRLHAVRKRPTTAGALAVCGAWTQDPERFHPHPSNDVPKCKHCLRALNYEVHSSEAP